MEGKLVKWSANVPRYREDRIYRYVFFNVRDDIFQIKKGTVFVTQYLRIHSINTVKVAI